MALATVNNPSYELKFHSVDQKIKYRPFLVKEEKILLTALEGGDTGDIVRATKEIIKNCCLTDDIEVENVDQIVYNSLNAVDSEMIDKKLLVDIYNNL